MPVKKVASATTKTSTAAKTAVKKPTSRAKAPIAKATTSTSSQVAANARHIQENSSDIQNNSKIIHIMYVTIILLMMVIAGLAFYVGQMLGNSSAPVATPATAVSVSAEDITVTVIDDARCADCQA
jgi:hypothetical protein